MDAATGILLKASQARLGLIVRPIGDPVAALQKLYQAQAKSPAFAIFKFHRKDPEIWIVKTGAPAPTVAVATAG